MDLQIHNAIVSKSTSGSKSAIEESQLKILKLKIDVMQLVSASFLNVQHRCLLSYMAACTLSREEIKYEDLSIFHNYESLVVDLKDGYFIKPYEKVERRQGKRDKKILYYELNFEAFFQTIRQNLTQIQNKMKKIKQFYNDSEKSQNKEGEQKKIYRRCKSCHTRQNIHVQMFGFDACEKCRVNQKEKFRIDKLHQIISIVFIKLKEIEDLEYKLKNKIEQLKEIQKNIKVKEIDRFMQPFERYLQQQNQKIELKINSKTIEQAEKLHAPLKEYQRVQEMIRSREQRQRSRYSWKQHMKEKKSQKLKSF